MSGTPEFYFTEDLYHHMTPRISMAEGTTDNTIGFRHNMAHLRGIGSIIQHLTGHRMIGDITASTFVFHVSEDIHGPAIYPTGTEALPLPANSQPADTLLLSSSRIPLGYPLTPKTENMLPRSRQATTLSKLQEKPGRYLLEVPIMDVEENLVTAIARAMTYSACVSTPFGKPRNRFGMSVNPDKAAAKAAKQASKKYPQAIALDKWSLPYR